MTNDGRKKGRTPRVDEAYRMAVDKAWQERDGTVEVVTSALKRPSVPFQIKGRKKSHQKKSILMVLSKEQETCMYLKCMAVYCFLHQGKALGVAFIYMHRKNSIKVHL